jgi:hypothetical protein
MTCPHLAYREASEDAAFDTPRAYCTVADRFVQPMRADICNDRYDLDHAEHCEIFREHAGNSSEDSSDEPEGGA